METENDPQAVGDTDADPTTVTATRDRSESVSRSVIAAVAEATGTDPTAMQPLYEVVDPDALDAIFDPVAGETAPVGCVSFRFNGCDVYVYADGRTVVSSSGDA